jgi:broad specificity phosphatase PhoE
MKYLFLFLFLGVLACTPAREIYVVRHAEKALATDTTVKMNANDPILSEAGKVRAFVLRDELANNHIKHIYSTNTIRTISTAEPLSRKIGVNIEKYASRDSLADQIRIQKGNVLVVGHSNTVDDIINRLTGKSELTDLKDFEYDNLYLIRQKGKRLIFEKKKYGYPSNPE